MWLSALHSFFNLRHQPLGEAEQASITERDWANEMSLTRQTLLRSTQLSLSMTASEPDGAVLDETAEAAALSLNSQADAPARDAAVANNQSLIELSESLGHLSNLSEALLDGRAVGFTAWTSFGQLLLRELERSDAAQSLMQVTHRRAAANLQAPLLDLTRKKVSLAPLASDLLMIFNDLTRLLEYLQFIEDSLRRDHPLKQTLLVFTLVSEEAQSLLDFIEVRALRTEGLDQAIFDALDSTQYVIAMELRKVFAYELTGLSMLHQAPPIFVRIENAHGLLRDCFQQSIVALAQLFDQSLDSSRLFDSFRRRLEQSLMLRRDLWLLREHVRRAAEQRENYPVSRLLEHLTSFREGSLRYLMYKDWESCERFIEEVASARGAAELAPVLHRFTTYLETLQEHVNMRAVLADQPFDYPPLETGG